MDGRGAKKTPRSGPEKRRVAARRIKQLAKKETAEAQAEIARLNAIIEKKDEDLVEVNIGDDIEMEDADADESYPGTAQENNVPVHTQFIYARRPSRKGY
ncbi:hypothetical protein T440DRAFT_523819 [Plenodomus tracheiphilus IPT5]|uniref:Uncharacterized protein n=1 Tax=Plenodomus tracheiphilus IPT5 TaxID=1408161 RepID=A0A6A7APC7_9PLEO|nr:hypothetical protein T440DRAFT_523819 [Plenodomus tracheiphilus IPT5]